MIRIILFSLFLILVLSCSGQNKNVFYQQTFNFKNNSIIYVSNIKSIKIKISKRNNLYKPLLETDSLSVSSHFETLNSRFNTDLFSEIIKVNQLEFSQGRVQKKEKTTFVGDITIQEWVFKDKKEAIEAYNYLLTENISEEGNPSKIPPTAGGWLQKNNLIYLISSESYYKDEKDFKEVFEIVKKTIAPDGPRSR
jgi:hypothetical protein